MKRLLIYSHDTFGLGNIRRMLEIARHLVQTDPALSVLIITGSPMLHAFRIPDRIDYVKLPCLSRNTAGTYGARFLDMALAPTVRLRANLIRSTIEDFAPDLILVDKKPFGVEDELGGALASLPAGMHRPKLVLLLRDILDSPEATQRIWRKNRYFDAIDTHYDAVLVVGQSNVFDLREEYAFPACAAGKVQFCGYIGRPPGRKSREQVRGELGIINGTPLVLVTPGGGEDGDRLVETWLDALEQTPAAQRPRSHIVFGPEMAEARRVALAKRADALPQITRQDFSDDMMSLMSAADVVVSMGGYNTVCEVLTLARRAVVVPRVRPVQEQCIRAERLAALGLLRYVHPDALTPANLIASVREEIEARHTPLPQTLPLDGLDGVAREIFAMLDSRAARLANELANEELATESTAAKSATHAGSPRAWQANTPSLAAPACW